ncbi:MAG: hypothetical protein R3B13_14010 [Polyangiaceae bacterium]
MNSGSENRGRPGPRRRRRGRKRPEQSKESAAIVIERARAVDTSKPADEPLSAEEAAEMREHFRFLRDNRKLLQLRLNAAEDLLINGAREPEHRGVCQHLLSKVDRARVESVVPRLDPAARSRFLAGVVRLCPDVPYLLLYLESVKESASQADATAALTRALHHIDFSQISAAQMRRLLDLIAELFDERDRPQLLFGLLRSTSFRDAFDRSAEALPSALADSFVPLRAVHAVVLRGKRNPHDAAALAQGAAILLGARDTVLRSHGLEAKRRLLELGLSLRDHAEEVASGLATLAKSLPEEAHERSEAQLRVAGYLLSVNREAAARRLLERLRRDAPGFKRPQRWLDALSAPRFGRYAAIEQKGESRRGSRFVSAVSLRTQQLVWLCTGDAADAESFDALAPSREQMALPGVLPLLEVERTAEGVPYFVVPKRGRGAYECIKKDGISAQDASTVCEDAVALLMALAQRGIELPDVRLDRFAIDSGRLWLRDWRGAAVTTPSDAAVVQLGHARELCGLVLGGNVQAAMLSQRVGEAESLPALASLFVDAL